MQKCKKQNAFKQSSVKTEYIIMTQTTIKCESDNYLYSKQTSAS